MKNVAGVAKSGGVKMSQIKYDGIDNMDEKMDFIINENNDLRIALAAAQERERVMREAATYAKIAIDNYIHKEWGVGEIQDAYDKLKAALERKEGGDGIS